MADKELLLKMEERYIELWKSGFRPDPILHKLAGEFGYSHHTLYKLLDVKSLKRRAEAIV
jgi:hypothetical protein